MPKILIGLTQGSADSASAGTISTDLTADGKSGWSVFALEAYYVNGEGAASADWEVIAALQTVNVGANFGSADEIARLGWGVQNTGGVAVAIPYEPVKRNVLLEPRVTVQPQLIFRLESTNTGQANNVVIAVYYDIVKLTDLEVLRLLAGGA